MSIYTKNLIYSVLFLSLLSLIVSCGEDGSGPNNNSNFGENSFTYDVEYSDDTYIVTEEKKSTLIKVDTIKVNETDPITGENIEVNHYNFTFNDITIANNVHDGSKIIIYGDYMAKVKSVVTNGSEVILETEPTTLKEVIKNGTIEWDITPEVGQIEMIEINGKKIKANKMLDDGFEYEFEWLDRKYTIWMNPKGTSANGLPEIQVNLICEKIDDDNGNVTATLGAKGITRLPRQNTKIEISNNEMTTMNSGNKSLRSELTLEYVAEMSFGGTQVLTMPNIMLKIPISSLTTLPVPIPMYITVGVGFSTTINMPVVSSFATAKVKLILDSDTGFEYQGPSVKASAKINDHDLGDAAWEIGAITLSPTPLEVRYDISCPRVGLQLCDKEFAWVSGVFSCRNMLIVPSLCKAALYQVRIDGGYSFSILGYDIAEDSGAITEVSREEKSPECP